MSTIVAQGLRTPHLLTQGYGPAAVTSGGSGGTGGGTTVISSAGTGVYLFLGTGGWGGPARAVPPTPQEPTLRRYEKNRIVRLDIGADVAPGDAVVSASVAVFARAEQYEPAAATDVTSAMLLGQNSGGTQVDALLDNANAVPGTLYSVRFVVTLVSGTVVEESVDPLICDL